MYRGPVGAKNVKMCRQLWPNIGFCKLLCRCNFNTWQCHQNSEAVLLRKAACGMTCECWMRKYIWANVPEHLTPLFMFAGLIIFQELLAFKGRPIFVVEASVRPFVARPFEAPSTIPSHDLHWSGLDATEIDPAAELAIAAHAPLRAPRVLHPPCIAS